MSREDILTTLEASQIVEAIHQLVEQKKHLEEENLDLLIKLESSEVNMNRLNEETIKLKTRNAELMQRNLSLTTRIVEVQEQIAIKPK